MTPRIENMKGGIQLTAKEISLLLAPAVTSKCSSLIAGSEECTRTAGLQCPDVNSFRALCLRVLVLTSFQKLSEGLCNFLHNRYR